MSQFRTNNDYLALIDILNTMYNDNLRQIDSITNTLHNLNESNNQIRNLLVRIMYNNNTSLNNTSANRILEYRNRNNTNRRNNRPYIIDSVIEYTIPLRTELPDNTRNSINASISGLENLLASFMQPVEVYPTQSQIEAATRRVQYCNISRPINTQCPISMEDFSDTDMVTIIRPCGHIFHTDMLTNWFRSNCRCPVCRYDIREYSSNSSTNFFNNTSSDISQQPRSEINDSSNNNTERTFINRMDSIGSNSSASGVTDPSGNSIDHLLDNSYLARLFINTINRNRNNS